VNVRWLKTPAAFVVIALLFALLILVIVLPMHFRDERGHVEPALDTRTRHLRMFQISRAFCEFKEEHGHFPKLYSMPSGRPVIWRVQVLPYLGHERQFGAYMIESEWSEQSESAIRGNVYGSDETSSLTAVVAIKKLANSEEFDLQQPACESRVGRADLNNAIAVIDVGRTQIEWLEPRDMTLQEVVQLLKNAPSEPKCVVILSNGDVIVATADELVLVYGT